ncbi:hypothetical protein ABZ477_03935 [Microbacterium sp. NPDC019599]|uniref:hypothetical protein n=1 Tax=Microbacterium sp. NPDC019599 TaxID=3154690 RepID=UPI0033EF9AF7
MNIEQTVSMAVEDLALGSAFTFDELVAVLQRRRGKSLRIVELSDLGQYDGVCAILFMYDSEDLVLHAQTDSVLHRQQFVLHEFAHMILDHGDDDDCLYDDVLLPDIPPSLRRRVLARQDLDCEIEVAAESLADRLAAAIRGSAFAESRYLEIFG